MYRELWTSFKATYGPILTIGGVAIGLAAWVYPASSKIEIGAYVLIPVVIFVLLVFFTLINAYVSKINHISPSVILAKEMHFQGSERTMLLTKPSPYFSHDSLVSIYYTLEDEIEALIGIGHVNNIQVNGKMQIIIVYYEQAYEEVIKSVSNSNATVLPKITIKPSIPMRLANLQELSR